MKKRKFSKYLLTWLLALIMVVGAISSTSVPVYAEETTEETTTETSFKYSLTYQAARILEDNDVKNYYVATFGSDKRLFLYKDPSYDYSTNDCRVYRLGYVVGDGTVKAATSRFIDSDDTPDISLLSGEYRQYRYSTGKVLSTRSYSDTDYDFNALCKFNTSSEADYSCDCYVFESLEDAASFFETGESDSDVRPPDDLTDPEPVDETWKQVILDIIKTWFGGTLELLIPPLEAIANGFVSLSESIIGVRDYIIDNLPKRMSNVFRTFFNDLDSSIIDSGSKIKAFHDFMVTKFEEILSFFEELLAWTESVAVDIGTAVTDAMFELMPDWLENLLKDHFNTYFKEPFENFTEFISSINDRVGTGFENLKTLSTNLSEYIDHFFEFTSKLLEGSFINDISAAILEATRDIWQPAEDYFFKWFVPDFDLIDTRVTELRSKLGFIDDFLEAGEYLLNFVKTLGTGSPPVFTINLRESKYMPAQSVTIDMSWYADYKPVIDILIAGVLYANFFLNVYKRLPEIINGAGMISSSAATISRNSKNK